MSETTFILYYRTIGAQTHYYGVVAPLFTSVARNLKLINAQGIYEANAET